MCGIAGVYSPNTTEQLGPLIQKMSDALTHRGPDDSGFYSSNYCRLAHRRLSIIDLSKDGQQPFKSADGRYHLVFNGEIYNYLELRKELESQGISFQTKTDTEVLLKSYETYGPKCLDKFNGMFAFAIYDLELNELFIARDRIGIKPLYYTEIDGSFFFASEIKALKHAVKNLTTNYQSLFDFLVFNRTDVFDETFYNEIKRLPKGHLASISEAGVKIQQWWNPANFLNNAVIHQAEIPERIEALMEQSLRFRMRSDVKVGSCLSGGLDSSILLGMLFKKGLAQQDYPTFTASYPNHPIDETAYVDELNQDYKFKNFRTYPTSEDLAKHFDEFTYYSDEPTTSPSFFSQYMVMKLARENKVTVLLDGQGGDENFAGYQYFHGFHLYGLLKQFKVGGFTCELVKSLIRKQHISAYQTLLFQLLPSSLKKQSLRKAAPIVHKDFFNEYIDKSKIFQEFFDAPDLNHSLLRHFQYKLEHLLRCEDRNSMAFSIEARVPYLDHNLVEFVLGLPGALKIKDGETKFLQKQALKQYTTERILNRTDKIGFGTPAKTWLENDYWTEKTKESYQQVQESYPDIFNSDIFPAGMYPRWKVNQLATWDNQ